MTKEPPFYEKNPKGHTWRLDEDFEGVDIFALDIDFHNGPECTTCGFSFCYHCHRSEVPEACRKL